MPEIDCPGTKDAAFLVRTVVLVFVVPIVIVEDDAVALADITIELADTDEIVAAAGMPVPVIGAPAFRYVVELIPLMVELPLVRIPLNVVVSSAPEPGVRLS